MTLFKKLSDLCDQLAEELKRKSYDELLAIPESQQYSLSKEFEQQQMFVYRKMNQDNSVTIKVECTDDSDSDMSSIFLGESFPDVKLGASSYVRDFIVLEDGSVIDDLDDFDVDDYE